MADVDRDTPLRLAALEHVRGLGETHDHLTATELKPGFVFEDERVPLMNPQRGIFKPRQMRFPYGAKKRPRLGRCWSSLPSSLRLCRLRCSSSSSRSLAG